ncbi:MAG: type II toxin-antitoxin system HicA family toxin [Thermoplasmatota archaeon]
MAKLPRTTAAKVEKALLRVGFTVVRQSGSHRIFRNAEGRRVTVPVHARKGLHPKVLRSILDESGSPEALLDLLR